MTKYVLGSDRKIYSIILALHLLKNKKIDYVILNGKKINYDKLIEEIKKDNELLYSYRVFEYLMEKNHWVGAGLKFGAIFRVYDRGERPEMKVHSKWVCFPVRDKIGIHELASKMRVAHSTKKTLLLAVEDKSGKIRFIEVKWVKL